LLLRHRKAELMDDPALDPILHSEALRGLEQLNVYSFCAESLWQQLQKFYLEKNCSHVRVLDLASGGGDIPIRLAKKAKQAGLSFEFVGADISATAIDFARHKAQSNNIPIQFMQLDALKETIPEGFDVIMTSLFTHHLDPADVIILLTKMRRATKQMVFVNDLIRSEFSMALVWLCAKILSRSPIVQHDGPTSVEAAYTTTEMREMAIKAGLNYCVIHPWLFCRQLLIWEKPI
jgi:2-polyprenyl-3-methyl-5-hydroxy-6-metoxy-1,4-benzoquinol methylase